MKTRHVLFRVLLALTLLLSQQVATAHVISHLSGGHTNSSGKQLPAADDFCGDCLAAAQLGSAATSSVVPILSDAGPAIAPSLYAGRVFLAGTACPFESRAPPL